MRKKVKESNESSGKRRVPPATSPERQENRCIALAMDLAEKQLRDGTASAQVIAHFVRQGSMEERLKKQILEQQKDLMAAKTEALQSAKRIEDLYANALNAMRRYSGGELENGEDENL